MSWNKSGTFTYMPDISCAISTMNNGVLDVSQDIMNFQVSRNINASSTFTCTLANPRRKYNRVINTMDKITVFLKRTSFVQVFTGYVTLAPIETLVPTPITINAYCTLRSLQMTYWDDTLLEFQSLLLNYMDSGMLASNNTLNDGGLAQVVVNLLTKVAAWDPNRIHIAPVPQTFIELASTISKNQDTANSTLNQVAAENIARILGVNDIVAGKSINGSTYNGAASNINTPPPNGGQGTSFSAKSAFALKTVNTNGKKDFPGNHPLNPVKYENILNDIYYCSLPFSYITDTNPKIISDAKSWIANNPYNPNGPDYNGRFITVSNNKTGRTVNLRATSITQKVDKSGNLVYQNGKPVPDPNTGYIQCHPGVVAYLNGAVGDPTLWNDKISVDSTPIKISWAID